MKRRILLCDILRSISAILIVLYHLTTRYDQMFGHAVSYKFFLPWGWMAWSVFFILSGFLHSTEPPIRITNYVVNKAARLYPTFWISMIICTIFTGLLLPELTCSFRELLINSTLLGNYLGIKSATGVDWTLSVELIFYFFVGVVILIRKKFKWKYTYEFLALLWVLISFVLNVFLNTESGVWKYVSILIVAPYAYMFVTGISLRMLYDGKNKIFAFINLAICMASHYTRYQCGRYMFFYLIVVAVFTAWMLVPVATQEKLEEKISKLLITKALVWIASISFPLYLIHEYIGFSLLHYFDSLGLTGQYMMLIPIGISFILAYLIHKYIEKPVGVYFKSLLKK